HELRTPMNGIIGYAHLLLEGYDGELTEAQVADVAQIGRSAERLLALINDVLDLSKIEAGHLDVAVGAIDVAAAVQAVLDELMSQAVAKGIGLAVEIAPELPN